MIPLIGTPRTDWYHPNLVWLTSGIYGRHMTGVTHAVASVKPSLTPAERTIQQKLHPWSPLITLQTAPRSLRPAYTYGFYAFLTVGGACQSNCPGFLH